MIQKSILLVEDDFLNRRLYKKSLSEIGYAIYEVKNTAEAKEVLQNESVHLVILDINLGEEDSDGIELAQYIREKHNIPFIYLTAYNNSEVISRAIATTPNSYLTKPFKIVDLITSVELAIRQHAEKYRLRPKIIVREGDYNVEISVEDIDYIESEGNYLMIYAGKKVYKSRSTIKQFLDNLPADIFIQTHRAYVVNKNKIEKFGNREVFIRNVVIPVSRKFTENILK